MECWTYDFMIELSFTFGRGDDAGYYRRSKSFLDLRQTQVVKAERNGGEKEGERT